MAKRLMLLGVAVKSASPLCAISVTLNNGSCKNAITISISWRGEGNLVLGRQAAGLTRRANFSLPRGKSPGWQPAAESAKLAHIQSNVNPDCISLRFNR
jgi:hypothetical protein